MAHVVRTIGSNSRDYSTPHLWEADLNNNAVYASGDVAVGECYADSVFNFASQLVINSGDSIFEDPNFVSLSGVILRAADGQGHNGTAATGVEFNGQDADINAFFVDYNGKSIFCRIEDLVITEFGGGPFGIICLLNGSVTSPDFYSNIRRCIVHDCEGPASEACSAIVMFGTTDHCSNCTVYNVENVNNDNGVAFTGFGATVSGFFNCTVHNCYEATNGAGVKVENCLATANTNRDYATTGANLINCMSSDATGSSGLQNVTTSNQYVSTVNGSEDLHLKAGADAIGQGNTISEGRIDGVSRDIDGADRIAAAVTWDLGADQFNLPVAVAQGNRLWLFF